MSHVLKTLRLGRPAAGLTHAARAMVNGKEQVPVGLIVGAVAAGLVLLAFLFVVIAPAFDRRRERARLARSTDAEAPVPSAADLEGRFQRSGADLEPVMAQAPAAPMIAVPLTPAQGAAPPNPFHTPPASPKAAAEKEGAEEKGAAPEGAEDPFADEVAAMQARLQAKFQVAHERFRE